MAFAPIVLFVYNRPEHTRKTLEALMNNDLANQSILFVFCDGPNAEATTEVLKSITKVREIIKSQKWCKTVTVFESDTNKGLANSIKNGVTQIINEFGKVIVLEDDIITAKGFLKYMNEALDLYEYEDRVMHIGSYLPYTNSGRSLPQTFFSRFMSCWGWATWKPAWDKGNWDTFDLYKQVEDPKIRYEFNLEGILNFHEQLEENMDGRIDTWAIKWFTSVFLNDALCLYPGKSLSDNIGLDGSGVHCEPQELSSKLDSEQFIEVKPQAIQESTLGKMYLKRFYTYGAESAWMTRLNYHYVRKRFQLIKLIKGL